MSHFRALHLSPSLNRENITSPSRQAPVSELPVSGNGEGGCVRHCPCWISSLVSTRAWFQCLPVWWFSPLNRNIFSILYFDFWPFPSVLSTRRQNNYWAIKKENIFLGHLSDNLLGCVTFIAECNHSLSKTNRLGEKYTGLLLGISPYHLCGADSTPRAEGALHSGHQILQQCLIGTASLFSGTEDELSSYTFKYHKTYQHV